MKSQKSNTAQRIYYLFFIIVVSCSFFSSCRPEVNEQNTIVKSEGKTPGDSLQNELRRNIIFFSDSLLLGKKYLLEHYMQKYQPDSFGIIAYANENLQETFEGVKPLPDINNDKIKDSVFVIPPFNYFDDGESYVFFDTTLPRLHTDSYCCHPDNLFAIGDIDEDSISEICIFYSSCSSRYKSLIAYSLKKGEWKKIGACTFDLHYDQPPKEKRVRKTGKGKFEMLTVEEEFVNGKHISKNIWEQFSFKPDQ